MFTYGLGLNLVSLSHHVYLWVGIKSSLTKSSCLAPKYRSNFFGLNLSWPTQIQIGPCPIWQFRPVPPPLPQNVARAQLVIRGSDGGSDGDAAAPRRLGVPPPLPASITYPRKTEMRACLLLRLPGRLLISRGRRRRRRAEAVALRRPGKPREGVPGDSPQRKPPAHPCSPESYRFPQWGLRICPRYHGWLYWEMLLYGKMQALTFEKL
jgi:hypothetical protein